MENIGQFISNHWQLSLAFFVVLALVLINELMMLKKRAATLSPQAAVAKINNEQAIVVDLRDRKTFETGHIIDSIQATEEDFSQPKMNKYKNKPLILVCARGLQSATVAAKISAQGYQPFVLSGGIEAWRGADLPLVKGGK